MLYRPPGGLEGCYAHPEDDLLMQSTKDWAGQTSKLLSVALACALWVVGKLAPKENKTRGLHWRGGSPEGLEWTDVLKLGPVLGY